MPFVMHIWQRWSAREVESVSVQQSRSALYAACASAAFVGGVLGYLDRAQQTNAREGLLAIAAFVAILLTYLFVGRSAETSAVKARNAFFAAVALVISAGITSSIRL